MKYLARKAGSTDWTLVEDADHELEAPDIFVDEHVQAEPGDVTFVETVMFEGMNIPAKQIMDAAERSGDLVLTLWRVECLASEPIRIYGTHIVTPEAMRSELAAGAPS